MTVLTLDPRSRALYSLDTRETVVTGDTVLGLCPGRAAEGLPSSEWAVWATGGLLDASECRAWIERGDALTYETGDFIFKTGRDGRA